MVVILNFYLHLWAKCVIKTLVSQESLGKMCITNILMLFITMYAIFWYTKYHFAVISFIKYLVKFSHQEKLLQEGEKYLQSKEDLRLMLTELRKKQEAGFALQHGLQEKKAQLKIYKKFLQKAQDLTSLLEELKSQGNYLLECTKNPSFSEEPWLEIKHLHESLLQQLQVKCTGTILNDCQCCYTRCVCRTPCLAIVQWINQKL